MKSSMRIALLLLLFGFAYAEKTCEAELQEQIANERKEDTEKHECRACKRISLAATNCPKMGYDCSNLMLPLTSTVLFPDECNCAKLRCANANTTLAVGGNLVGKVRCKGRKWHTPDGEAVSAACARKCGLGVCKELPESFFEGQDIIGPLDVHPPDNEHPCAWATCTIGAVAAIVLGGPDIIFKGPSNFACTGDHSWRYTGPGVERRNLQVVACVIKDCNSLPAGFTNEVCTNGKYMCYAATLEEGDGDDWKKMTCPDEHALRRTDNNEEIAPTCKIGTWAVKGGVIASNTEVMCITCPTPSTDPKDDEKPVIAVNNKAVTCNNGKLTIEYDYQGLQQIEVTSLICTDSFAWTATGGIFTPFSSLEEVVNQGITWKVKCVTGPPKPCETLIFKNTSSVCTSNKFECYAPTMVDDGEVDKKKMTCVDANALRRSDNAQEIAPTCTKGTWSVGGNPIPSTTEVMCISCALPNHNPFDVPAPSFPSHNKAVICKHGKLTVEFDINGHTSTTSVTTLTCSDQFEMHSTGGDFSPYSSLQDAVSKGATWKVKCVMGPATPCKSLPTTKDKPYCKDKYDCFEPTFDQNKMFCGNSVENRPFWLRLADDTGDKVVRPQCIEGKWTDNGKDIPDTTEVTCTKCNIFTLYSTDPVKPERDDPIAATKMLCQTKSLKIWLQEGDRIIPVDSIICNAETQIWQAEGADLTPYKSIEEMQEKKIVFTIRCL